MRWSHLGWSKLPVSCAFVLLMLGAALFANEAQAVSLCDPTKAQPLARPITLRVALYPYVPDRMRIFQILEAEFECMHPGLNLELVEERNASDRYYDFDVDKRRGFQFVEADVYEIDTILLSDFIKSKKISPIDLPYGDFEEGAVKAVARNGKTYAVPHWLCGNFLFYRQGDEAIKNAKTWAELSKILQGRGQNLLVDLKGKLTLGEWYLTMLSELIGIDAAQAAITSGGPLDDRAIATIGTVLQNCPLGYCRSQVLHERTGIYARAFIRGQAAAYIGYSESIHLGLRENWDNCIPGSGCLKERDIAVRRLPAAIDSGTGVGLGWVDGLAIDAKLTGDKRDLALAFIRFVTDSATYKLLLAPEWPYRSRYLLSARPLGDIEDALLYPALHAAHVGRQTGTAENLNPALRKFVEKVDCKLPRDRDDGTECTGK